MRIQHNIPAMNSYRNYGNNVKAVNKNLEKLSSGYKINRAGDDAAGLAISEKMRAQIKGLEAAQKNVKDGTSLVKTAEGAMQEIQDMLDRMKYLATQSANGTYDNEVDRANLNKEVTALKTEIDRIADSANFNGIKLLDGSLESPNGAIMYKLDNGTEQSVESGTGAKFAQEIQIKGTSNGNDSEVGKQGSLQISYLDKDGVSRNSTINFTIANSITNTAKNMMGAIKDMFGGDYNVTLTGTNNDTIKIEAGSNGEDKTKILDVKQYDSNGVELKSSIQATAQSYVSGQDEMFDLTTDILAANKSKKFEVDGVRYQIVQRGTTADAGYTALYVDQKVTTTDQITSTHSIKQVIDQLNANGVSATDGQKGDNKFDHLKLVKTTAKGGGLQLQIGDTADQYNQMKVGVHDMHSDALGIASVDISTQAGAAAAIDKIKDAINTVSATRGDLGAIQNRLDHTLNNLSVMTENIQDAESTIRDTDVADEMMSYTKNNILIQSAQAMLAQANQIPQGVLQLLG